MSCKQWCFTINNPLLSDTIDPALCVYLVLGKEVGALGTPHLQGYAWFHKKQSLRQLKGLNARAHWELAKGTPYQNKVYCTKDGDFQEFGIFPTAPGPSHKKKIDDGAYSLVLEQATVAQGLALVKSKRPRDYCLHGETIERNLKKHKFVPTKALYALDAFSRGALPLIKATFIWGPSNTGKTQFALAHFQNPLFVSHIEKLKLLSSDHDAIVFDDMSFKHWPPEAVIHLLDLECDREINVRYGTVTIPAKTVKVFTHNTSNPFYNEEIDQAQKDAIERRLDRVNVHNKLFKIVAFTDSSSQ